MDPKELLPELRTEHGRSQGRLAEKMHVTRQTASCWETGETVTNIIKSPDGARCSRSVPIAHHFFIAPHMLQCPYFGRMCMGM